MANVAIKVINNTPASIVKLKKNTFKKTGLLADKLVFNNSSKQSKQRSIKYCCCSPLNLQPVNKYKTNVVIFTLAKFKAHGQYIFFQIPKGRPGSFCHSVTLNA